MMREIARRFNHLYGKEKGFEEKARGSGEEAGRQARPPYDELRTAFQEQGKADALEQAQAMLDDERRTCRMTTASACSAIWKAAAS